MNNGQTLFAMPYSYNLELNLAPNQVVMNPIQLLSDQDFELMQLITDLPDDFRIIIIDGSAQTGLMMNFANSPNIFGTAQRPFNLPVSYVFSANRQIVMNIQNGGIANQGTITLRGQNLFNREELRGYTPQETYYPGIVDFRRTDVRGSFFCYPLDITFTALNQTLNYAISLMSNAYFELYYLNHDTAQGGDYRLQVTDGSTGRSMFDTATPINNAAGTGQRPYIYPVTQVFRAKGSINVQVTNTSALPAFNSQLCFIGANLLPQE